MFGKTRVRRLALRLGAAAGVAAAIAVVLLLLPQSKHGVVDRARAAIGDGRVLHIVAEVPTGTVDVDLQTRQEVAEHYRLELWADQDLDRLHATITFRGQAIADLLWPDDDKNGATLGPVDPAFTALWTGYRKALADGDAERAGEGTAFGHHVYWLSFRSTDPGAPGSEVAVDTATYEPIVYRIHQGGQTVDQHILVAETGPFDVADFTRKGPDPESLGSGSSGVGASMESDGGKPSTVVPPGWLTAGPEADGHPLAAVVPQTITPTGKETIHGYELVYGPLQDGLAVPGGDATTVDEAPKPDDPGTWADIPAGTVQIEQGQGGTNGSQPMWTGYLVENGRYITITSQHGRQAVVDIAAALRPAG